MKVFKLCEVEGWANLPDPGSGAANRVNGAVGFGFRV